MTLPTNVTLPFDELLFTSEDPKDLVTYLRKLVYVLSTFIQQTNQAVNGTTKFINENSNTLHPYTFILGSTTAGAIPPTVYTNTILWSRRVNGMVFIWFDITWAAHNGTGNVLVQLPYFSQESLQFPYIGVIEPDSMAFTAGYTYLTGNLIPNTNTIEIHQCGSGVPTIPLPLTAAGHLRGSIVYAGQQFR